MQRLMTVNDVADVLRLHPKTVYRLAAEKRIPSKKRAGLGLRFRPTDIEKWQAEGFSSSSPLPVAPVHCVLPIGFFDRVKPKGGRKMSAGKRTRWNYRFGAVYVRKTKGGNDRWYVDYCLEGKRTREVVREAQSQEEAVLALNRKITEAYDGKYQPKRIAERLDLAQLAERFMCEYSRPTKSSWKDDEYRLKPILEQFGHKQIALISDSDILKFRQRRLEEGLSRLTANREIALMKTMFNFAVRKGLLEKNPAVGVKLFSERDTARTRVLSAAEEVRLLASLARHLRPIVLLALHTGLRYREILNLEWKSVDFDRNFIKAEHTKSHKARLIPMNVVVRSVLRGLRESPPTSSRVFKFTDIHCGFKNACRRAGIGELTFHDLRRSFGTRLLELGVDIVTISKLYGHGSVLVTQNYLHPQDELGREAVDKLVLPEYLSHGWHTDNSDSVSEPTYPDDN